MTLERHYSKVTDWKWYYFKPSEIACKGSGFLIVDDYSMNCLCAFRHIMGIPFSPNSAYRSEKYNKKVGGAPNSYHRLGKAFDIPIRDGMSREKIHGIGRLVGFTGFGDYDTFVHIDTGQERCWDIRT